ncbi:MAG: M42 family metallopeptidase [Candidatus Fimenecus sp.]
METKELLQTLCAAPGVSGDETAACEAAKALFASLGEVRTDALGNLICTYTGTEYGRKILLDAHLDQIGLCVLEITPEGFLRTAPCGGTDKRVLCGAEVTVHGKQDLYGVVTSTPPHLQKDGEEKTLPDTILVDIGLSADKAQSLVSAGDRVSLRYSFTELFNHYVSAPALDDRAGIAVLYLALEYLKMRGCSDTITVVCSTREETTEGGAKAAAFNAQADLCIAVDVSFAKTPDAKAEGCGELAKGPMIGVAPSLTLGVSEGLRQIAIEQQIPYQIEVMGGLSGTNADVIASEVGGVQTGLLSVPLRYMHTGIEIVSVKDVENTARLLANYILYGGLS